MNDFETVTQKSIVLQSQQPEHFTELLPRHHIDFGALYILLLQLLALRVSRRLLKVFVQLAHELFHAHLLGALQEFLFQVFQVFLFEPHLLKASDEEFLLLPVIVYNLACKLPPLLMRRNGPGVVEIIGRGLPLHAPGFGLSIGLVQPLTGLVSHIQQSSVVLSHSV